MSAVRFSRIRRLVLIALAVVVPATGLALWRGRAAVQQAPVLESNAPSASASDPIIELQQRLDSGKVKLKFDGDLGYLVSLLENLKIHVKEQAGAWKYPRWIELRDGLPRTATGKIQRFKLRDEDLQNSPSYARS